MCVLYSPSRVLEQLLDVQRLLPFPTSGHPADLLASFASPIASLRLKMEGLSEDGIGFGVEQLLDVQCLAVILENGLSRWPCMVSPAFQPSRSSSAFAPGDEDFPRWTETYESLDIANAWNLYRGLRILVNLYISRCALALPGQRLPENSPQVICQEMVDGVCATVPFHLGPLSLGGSGAPGSKKSAGQVDERRAATALGAMYIQPRLRWILSQSMPLKPGQVDWIRRQIDTVDAYYWKGPTPSTAG